ncbi:MAG: hypothetical protein HEQ34_13710 [Sphingorhabdus sp.]|uniref:hypothetical protein n=1 Tax=Sphingorhabdus sp. TaxID=1902408 RepID=UPI0025D4B21D|nr:hypothetical protein [Sphingorhabdus sp.]MCO4092987.1 hypothetical protein [Sphingorhabdus sp.]
MRAALTQMVFLKRPILSAKVDHRDTRLKGLGSCPAARILIITNMRAPHFSGLIDEFVPGEAAVIDDIVMGFEYPVVERFCRRVGPF